MTFPSWPDGWLTLAAVVVGVLGAARLTRLIVADKYPPSGWVRSTWDRITRDGDWSLLVHCHWCLGPWMGLLALGTAFIETGPYGPHLVWWLVWGWLGGSYLVSMIVERDEVTHEH